MRLTDYIAEDLVFVVHEQPDKRSFLAKLATCVAERFPDIDGRALLTRLIEREEQASTGIGHGVAIPHATIEGLDKTWCVIAQIPEGTNFEALDGSPVHIVFLLLSPSGKIGDHLRLLARIARLASNEEFISQSTTVKEADKLYALVVEEDGRHV
ncbi:MAG: PTS sugar transporter subunit IIA [Proteobacteria bacterium]|nr:PTS sugar transporter subunit IIA [Pseudomonadota bacterium]